MHGGFEICYRCNYFQEFIRHFWRGKRKYRVGKWRKNRAIKPSASAFDGVGMKSNTIQSGRRKTFRRRESIKLFVPSYLSPFSNNNGAGNGYESGGTSEKVSLH